ncbi:zinc finger MYM-type protein 1-like [Bufo gargarizans]|uniref:zinc finger MYM-type protein 1-like n=1 Tax=Bufo gargarizans TaxID=30331 RepID=UPI001CF5080C|nr:zinc finger MYM-type protein 1-like [Bufo gargarizans]XP_044151376.1 zinc finger MYM-type protein 1-like [Bufo gargarizans]
MGPKKLSGSQNRKRKVLMNLEDQKSAGALKKFLGRSAHSASEATEEEKLDDVSCSSQADDVHLEKNEPSTSSSCLQDLDSSALSNPLSSNSPPDSVSSEKTSESLSDPALWPKLISKNVDRILEFGPVQVTNMEFKKDVHNRHFSATFYKRKLESGEEQTRRWLVYSPFANKAFCFSCKLFDWNAKSSLASGGSEDWRHMANILKSHETSSSHFLAQQMWMETQLRLKSKSAIDHNLQSLMSQERKHWRSVMERLLNIVHFLTERNLAFRGSSDRLFTPHNGNFLGLVELLGKYDNVMAEHLRRVASKETADHYCGKTIQNEIINLMAKQVLEDILERCRKAKYYSIILDCTPDISHKEQMSFTVRFLDNSTGDLKVKEHFIGFQTVDDTTGKGLADFLLQFLSEKKLDIDNCCGQGYDNGANMAGKNSGVQSRVLSINPRAIFVPCGCHCLNLVIGDAARSGKESLELFGVIQRIYVLFSASVKRWKILTDHVSGLTLKPLCTTRWECRINCLKPFRHNLVEIQDALIALSEEEHAEPSVCHEALTLSQQVGNFKCIMALCVWYEILYQVNIVSKAMQRETADLILVTELIDKCKHFVQIFRDTGFESAFLIAKEIAQKLEVEPVFLSSARIRRKKALFNYEGKDEPLTNPKERFKIEFFYALVDTTIMSLDERFDQLKNHTKVWGFLYTIKCLPARENLTECCLMLQKALEKDSQSLISGIDLAEELWHIQGLIPQESTTPLNVLNFIVKNRLTDTFPNIWIALRILLTIPVSVASGERSFSKLKLIKTYLRSSMSDERLTSLSVLSIENDVFKTLDLNSTIDEFAKAKARKVVF